MKHKLLSILLCLAMALSLLPTAALADEGPDPVAQIGDTEYATLADAIAAANNGDTITLLADVIQNTMLTIDKNITLDLNGKKICNTEDIWNEAKQTYELFNVEAEVTITGNGSIEAKANDCYTINVKNGNLTIENGIFVGNVSVVQVESGTLTIKGGEFKLLQKWEGTSKYLINCIDENYKNKTAVVDIRGGKFVDFDPNVAPEEKVDGKAPSFVTSAGIGVTKDTGGNFTAVPNMAAQIVDAAGNSVAAYATLQDAVDAAENGQTVKLLKDAELTKTLDINKAITLDGANYKITGRSSPEKSFIKVETDGDFTMKNATILPTSKVEANAAIDLWVKGKVVVDNCVFGAADDTKQFMYNGLEFSQSEDYPMADGTTISNCTFYGGSFRHNFISFYRMADGATININGNKFLNANWNTTNAIRVSNYSNVSATINLLNDTYSDHGDDSGKDYAGLLFFQQVVGHQDDFTQLTVNIENLDTTGAQSNQLFYVYSDITKKIISTDQPVIKGDSSIEKFFAAKVGDTSYYETLADAITAADENATVTLLKDVTEAVAIPEDKTITLDLNGKTLKHEGQVLDIYGNLTIKNGTVELTSGNAKAAIWLNKAAKLTIDSDATVSVPASNFAIGLWSDCTAAELTVKGTLKGGNGLTVNGTIANPGNKVTVDGATIESEGHGIYQAGVSDIVVKNANITGATGIEVRAGKLTVDNSTISGSGEFKSEANSGGPTTDGAGIAIVQHTTNLPINVTISGGSISGPKAIYQATKQSQNTEASIATIELSVTGGEFTGEISSENLKKFISGGSFSTDLKNTGYLADSVGAEVKSADGSTYSYYTSMDDALAAAKPGDTVTDLKAATEQKVTLTLKYNDGATADTTYNVASGTTITLPTPAYRSGYTFNGWYDGSTKVSSPYKVMENVTLTASWSYNYSSGSSSYDPTYSVSTPSKTENGSVTVSPKSASKGDTVTVTVKPDSGYVLETLTVTDKNGNELTLKDKGNGKYTFTMPAGKVEVKATFMEDNSMLNFFYDVPNNAYFYEAVKWAVKNGITTGVGNNLFAPEQPCTRAQIVTFLWRAAGSPEPKGAASGMTDVVSGSYYEKAVAWAIENGITTGTTTTTFSPDATCTRAQAVTFLARALKAKAASAAEFSDVPTGSYFADAVAWAAANGVTEGIGGGLFGSDNDCTRGQIVTFLYRAYNK